MFKAICWTAIGAFGIFYAWMLYASQLPIDGLVMYLLAGMVLVEGFMQFKERPWKNTQS